MLQSSQLMHSALFSVGSRFGEKEVIVVAGNFREHVGDYVKDKKYRHRGYSFRIKNKERERIMEFCATVDKTVRNTLTKQRKSLLVECRFVSLVLKKSR